MLAQQPETLPLRGAHAQVGRHGFVKKNNCVAQLAAHLLSLGQFGQRYPGVRFLACHLS
jgi:hypothetical protein